jgi:hypothetical protein
MTLSQLNCLVSLFELNKAIGDEKTRPRPKHKTDRAKRDLLAWFDAERTQFVEQYPRRKATDTAVLRWFFERVAATHGRRSSTMPASRIKTLQNRLSEARRTLNT